MVLFVTVTPRVGGEVTPAPFAGEFKVIAGAGRKPVSFRSKLMSVLVLLA